MRQLFIDSRDRVSGSGGCDFTIQLPSTLTLEGGNHRARIDNFRLPITVPTIQTGYNDTIIVQIVSTRYTATVTQANYDFAGLATAIQTALQGAAPGTWAVVYDASNISMTITCSNNFTIVGGTYAAQLMSRPYTNTANSYKFSYVPVNGVDLVYLCSPNFASLDTYGPGGSHDTLCSIIITEPYGAVQDFSMGNPNWFNCPNLTTQQLSFQLRDRSYNIMSIVPNISFVLTID
jgi:hypothetical protein